MDSLSIVIPVYNEENAVLPTLEELHTILKKVSFQYEVILVNDGSTDKTAEVLKGSSYDFKLIEHQKNKGYGAALKTGISESQYDAIAITDADRTYPNEKIPELFEQLKNYNMVVGQRPFKKLPMMTKPAKWCLNKLANYLSSTKIPDINSGLRLFRKKDALRFFNIIPDGFSFTTTITLAMLTNKLDVKYVPIEYKKREGKSKIKPFQDTMNFIQLIIRTVLYFNPLKIFVPLFFILIFLALMVLVLSYFFMPSMLDTTVTILFISAIQVLTVGMIADLIDKRM
jgi:glycosyltransferase involved in cell wall biosynthesis